MVDLSCKASGAEVVPETNCYNVAEMRNEMTYLMVGIIDKRDDMVELVQDMENLDAEHVVGRWAHRLDVEGARREITGEIPGLRVSATHAMASGPYVLKVWDRPNSPSYAALYVYV